MTDNLPTVLQKFWDRALRNPDRRALIVCNTQPVRELLQQTAPLAAAHEYDAMSCGDMASAVAIVAAFLKSRGFKKGDRASICAWNSPAWVITDLAILSLGGITAPIFPTTTEAGVQYILKNSGARFLFSDDIQVLNKAAPGSCETVLFSDIPEIVAGQKADVKLPFAQRFLSPYHIALHPGLRCAVKDAKARFEKPLADDPTLGVRLADLATIVYTSGSTGVPKGVMISHGNLAYACDGMVRHGFRLYPERDVYLSYLPLSHIYERAAGMMLCMWTGVPMAFCRPDVKDELSNTLKALHPELLHAVPAIWRKVADNIEAGLAAKTLPFEKWLKLYAAREGEKSITALNKEWLSYAAQASVIRFARKQPRGTLGGRVADKLVLSKIRHELGGHIRLCTSGGGPISKELLQYFYNLGIDVLQGYGMTETTGAVTVNRPDGCGLDICNQFGAAGQLLSVQGLQMRIAPIPGWPKADNGAPEVGEIQFKGPTVMVGYWQMPEETAKTFTQDGWLRTGDVGYVNEQDFLVITDRLKRMLKTDGAKFVAPQKIEKAFDQQPIVQYIVPVGDGKPFFSALIFVNQTIAQRLLAEEAAEVAPADLVNAEFIARHPLVVKAVEQAVAAGNSQLEHWEQIKKFRIIEVEATSDNGLLTDLKKPRVEEIMKRYKALIEEFYQKPRA